MSQEEYSPTLAPTPTPQNTLIEEDSLHLTPVKRTPTATAFQSGQFTAGGRGGVTSVYVRLSHRIQKGLDRTGQEIDVGHRRIL